MEFGFVVEHCRIIVFVIRLGVTFLIKWLTILALNTLKNCLAVNRLMPTVAIWVQL